MALLIAQAIAAIAEGLKLANTVASRKYIDRLVEIQMELLREENKGYESDDARIENLYKELSIIFQAAKSEIALLQARANS
jgi:hypothetical protein